MQVSDNLWCAYAAMTASVRFVQAGDFTDSLLLADLILPHRHPLIHRAVARMLNQIARRDRFTAAYFIEKHRQYLSDDALAVASTGLDLQ